MLPAKFGRLNYKNCAFPESNGRGPQKALFSFAVQK